MDVDCRILRQARPEDAAALDRVLARAFGTLSPAEYPPDLMARAMPLVGRSRPELLASGTYFVVEDGNGLLLGAGGWTPDPAVREALGAEPVEALGHLRHFGTEPSAAGDGVASRILAAVVEQARAAGIRRLACLSTLCAEPFYRRRGFETRDRIAIPMGPGLDFPAVRMRRAL